MMGQENDWTAPRARFWSIRYNLSPNFVIAWKKKSEHEGHISLISAHFSAKALLYDTMSPNVKILMYSLKELT